MCDDMEDESCRSLWKTLWVMVGGMFLVLGIVFLILTFTLPNKSKPCPRGKCSSGDDSAKYTTCATPQGYYCCQVPGANLKTCSYPPPRKGLFIVTLVFLGLLLMAVPCIFMQRPVAAVFRILCCCDANGEPCSRCTCAGSGSCCQLGDNGTAMVVAGACASPFFIIGFILLVCAFAAPARCDIGQCRPEQNSISYKTCSHGNVTYCCRHGPKHLDTETCSYSTSLLYLMLSTGFLSIAFLICLGTGLGLYAHSRSSRKRAAHGEREGGPGRYSRMSEASPLLGSINDSPGIAPSGDDDDDDDDLNAWLKEELVGGREEAGAVEAAVDGVCARIVSYITVTTYATAAVSVVFDFVFLWHELYFDGDGPTFKGDSARIAGTVIAPMLIGCVLFTYIIRLVLGPEWHKVFSDDSSFPNWVLVVAVIIFAVVGKIMQFSLLCVVTTYGLDVAITSRLRKAYVPTAVIDQIDWYLLVFVVLSDIPLWFVSLTTLLEHDPFPDGPTFMQTLRIVRVSFGLLSFATVAMAISKLVQSRVYSETKDAVLDKKDGRGGVVSPTIPVPSDPTSGWTLVRCVLYAVIAAEGFLLSFLFVREWTSGMRDVPVSISAVCLGLSSLILLAQMAVAGIKRYVWNCPRSESCRPSVGTQGTWAMLARVALLLWTAGWVFAMVRTGYLWYNPSPYRVAVQVALLFSVFVVCLVIGSMFLIVEEVHDFDVLFAPSLARARAVFASRKDEFGDSNRAFSAFRERWKTFSWDSVSTEQGKLRRLLYRLLGAVFVAGGSGLMMWSGSRCDGCGSSSHIEHVHFQVFMVFAGLFFPVVAFASYLYVASALVVEGLLTTLNPPQSPQSQ